MCANPSIMTVPGEEPPLKTPTSVCVSYVFLLLESHPLKKDNFFLQWVSLYEGIVNLLNNCYNLHPITFSLPSFNKLSGIPFLLKQACALYFVYKVKLI